MRTPRPDPRLLVVKETCRKNSHFLHVPRWSLCAVTHHSRQRCYRQCPARCGGVAIPSVCRPKTSWPTTTWTLSRVGTVDPVGMACPLPKATGSPPLPRFQNRACAFPFTRLLSGAAPVMSTIERTGLGDTLSTLHTYLGTAGFMSYACLLAPLPSTPPLPRQPILGITPGLRFLGDPSS